MLIKIVEHLKEIAVKRGQADIQIKFETGIGAVAATILSLVSLHEVWMIVMGNRKSNSEVNLLYDSNIFLVTKSAGCPVLLVP